MKKYSQLLVAGFLLFSFIFLVGCISNPPSENKELANAGIPKAPEGSPAGYYVEPTDFAAPVKLQCVSTTQCSSGQVCERGKCISVTARDFQCNDDYNCKPNEYCNLKTLKCEPYNPDREQCHTRLVCNGATGLCSPSNYCLHKAEFPCRQNSDCANKCIAGNCPTSITCDLTIGKCAFPG